MGRFLSDTESSDDMDSIESRFDNYETAPGMVQVEHSRLKVLLEIEAKVKLEMDVKEENGALNDTYNVLPGDYRLLRLTYEKLKSEYQNLQTSIEAEVKQKVESITRENTKNITFQPKIVENHFTCDDEKGLRIIIRDTTLQVMKLEERSKLHDCLLEKQNSKLKESDEKLKYMNRKNDSQFDLIDGLNNRIQDLSKGNSKLRSEKGNYMEEINALKSRIENFKFNQREDITRMKELKRRTGRLEDENSELKRSVKNSESDLRRKQLIIDQLIK